LIFHKIIGWDESKLNLPIEILTEAYTETLPASTDRSILTENQQIGVYSEDFVETANFSIHFDAK
jgi:hypothetical protein